MTQRTRYFLVGSALVMMVGLCTGLVAYYSDNNALLTTTVGPSEFAYLPAETTAVAYADVRSIMNSEFRQKLKQVLPTGEAKDELMRETGIDLERDIDSVVAGFTATPPSMSTSTGLRGGLESGPIALVRGRFNDGNIETLATQHGAKVETYKGKRVIVMADRDATAGSPEHAGGVAFLEPGLLALGEITAVRRAIDTAASHEDITKNAELIKYVNEIQSSGNAWIVGKMDTVTDTAGLPEQVKSQVAGVQWFSVSARVNGGVNGVLKAETGSDQDAENLRDIIRGGIAAARMMAGQDAKMTAMLNSVQLQGTGKTVAMTFTVPPEMLDIINGVAAMGNNKTIKR